MEILLSSEEVIHHESSKADIKALSKGRHLASQSKTVETLWTFQEESESNDEGQQCRMFNEPTHPKVTERQALNSEQSIPSVEQATNGILSGLSRGPVTQYLMAHAKESDFQEKEHCEFTSESEVSNDNVSNCNVLQTLLMAAEASVTLVVPPATSDPTMSQQERSNWDHPTSTATTQATQAESYCHSQKNPSANETNSRLVKSGACSSVESLLVLDDGALLSVIEKDGGQHTGANSLARDERCQAMSAATGSKLGEDKNEHKMPVLPDNTCDTVLHVTMDSEEQECPVCIELYDSGTHKQALLNCNHSFCDSCVKSIMEKAAVSNTSQICCPICRQRTPMPEWEIRQLQEEMTCLNGAVAGRLVMMPTPPAPQERPCMRLEQTFRQRLFTTRRCGYLPCLQYPLWLVNALAQCDQTSPYCYLCSILLLYGLELLCLSLIFTPVIILILLFTLLDKE
ncbi:uncharacterized protein LOC125486354 [Rhincodon typus]|uniref:uncharacterized protein LOC125486354 n=1 Tax=Rhincodon typus TaxID=259920 RepID=UPI00202DBE95|nr:uncharacterized protein LOC125486354 [Rhincodon typus]